MIIIAKQYLEIIIKQKLTIKKNKNIIYVFMV